MKSAKKGGGTGGTSQEQQQQLHKQRLLTTIRGVVHFSIAMVMMTVTRYPLASIMGRAVERETGEGGGGNTVNMDTARGGGLLFDDERSIDTNVYFYASHINLAASESIFTSPSSSSSSSSDKKASSKRTTNKKNKKTAKTQSSSQLLHDGYALPQCLEDTFMWGRRFLWASITCATLAGAFARLSLMYPIPLQSRKGKVSFLSLVVDLRMPVLLLMAHLLAFTALLLPTIHCSSPSDTTATSSSLSTASSGGLVGGDSSSHHNQHHSSSFAKSKTVVLTLLNSNNDKKSGREELIDVMMDTSLQNMETGRMLIMVGMTMALMAGLGEAVIGCLAIFDHGDI